MIRKTVPGGGKKYIYYICKSSKLKSCKMHSISEKLLEEAIMTALHTHISNIKSLKRILTFIDTLPVKQEEIQRIDKQLNKIQEETNRYRDLKVSLYESMMSGIIDEDEYRELKESYSQKSDETEKAALKLSGEIDKIRSSKGEKNFWIEQFKEYRNITTLTRKIVVSLIDEILVYEDNRINIRFRYQYNYESEVNFM